MADEISLDGVNELIAQLEALGANVSKVENDVLRAAAQPVADDMRSLVPVSIINHKHIRDDIEISRVNNDEDGKYLTVGPGKVTAWRAKFIEWGTSKMPANPFVQPAGERNSDEVSKIIGEKLREGLGL